jgi:leader peptidase (prepilin peptidase)/N-methyltransferase
MSSELVSALALFVVAAAGAAWGVAADRLAARWPEHEPDTPRRGIDWRTAFVAIVSAIAFAALVVRFSDPRDVLLLGVYTAALAVLLATDLDQKLLPDALTLPLMVLTAVMLVVDWSPLLAGTPNALVNGVAAGIGAPVILFLLDILLKGALGAGDLKLSVSIGLLAGISRFFTGFVIASAASSFVLLALIAARRIGLRTAIPFGPVLIGAAFVAMFLP